MFFVYFVALFPLLCLFVCLVFGYEQDALHSDVVEALMTSTNVVVAELFDPVAGKRAVKVRLALKRLGRRGRYSSSSRAAAAVHANLRGVGKYAED